MSSIKWQDLKKKKVFLKYFSSSFLALPVSLITGFITFKFISPEEIGLWTSIVVFETYINFLRFGIINGMNRQLPFEIGRKDYASAERYASTTLWYTRIVSALIIGILPFGIYNFNSSILLQVAIAFFLLKVALNFQVAYLVGTFRSEDQFNYLSNVQFYVLVLRLVISPLIFLGIYGFLAYDLILILFQAILLFIKRPMKVQPKFHKTEFLLLFKIGFPVFIGSFLIQIIETFPRLYLIQSVDLKTVGLFAPVLILLNIVSTLPNALSTYLYPKFSIKLGENMDINQIWTQIKKVYIYSFISILILVVFIYSSIDSVIVFFPKYIESLPYLKISLIICPFVFYKLSNMLNNVFNKTINMVKYITVFGLSQIFTLLIFNYIFTDKVLSVIYSQAVTYFVTLIYGIITNRSTVKNYAVSTIS